MTKKVVKLDDKKSNVSCVLLQEQDCLKINNIQITISPINFTVMYCGDTNKTIKNVLYIPRTFKAYCTLLSLIRSCFDGGYWDNNKPWLNDTVWKN